MIDASVAAKCAVTEAHTEVARRIVRSGRWRLLAPDLLRAELGSAVWARHRRREFGPEEASSTLAELRALPIRTYGLRPLLPAALDVATRLGHSLYDCLYLALAVGEDCPAITADRRFYGAVARSVWADRIEWIEDAP